MKATINGITVEGTPQEIAEYAKLQMQQSAPIQPQATRNPYESMYWLGIYRPYPTGSICGGASISSDQLTYTKMYNDAVAKWAEDIKMRNWDMGKISPYNRKV